ncbi:MAG: pyruvate, phosphate dikinase [Alicyclobacillaceae bacterium]|nr:pyruvate, phosphate dikinase [Alicyclobacillaceae bacterium]
MTEKRYIYAFDEGSAEMRDLLGGKGAGLAEMTRAGLPVPEGFTITTEACRAYFAAGGRWPEGLLDELDRALARLEERTGLRLGDPERPLLVSVRSGAVFSMPGMMDTILNLGLNDEAVQGLARRTGQERFAWDCYRRFIQMYGDVVLGVRHFAFEEIIEGQKEKRGVKLDTELTAEDWREVVERYKQLVLKETKRPFPQDPREQLLGAVRAVFESWNNQRAVVYRRIHGIPDDLGTAVNIQRMVFGNWGDDSGTGVVFTRNPSTGERTLYGEFLLNAQGEDVVAGIRTPSPIAELKQSMPAVYDQLVEVTRRLEDHYRDMQDIEFTVERGKLYLLQTRAAKRTAQAAVKVAVDLAKEGTIDREEALRRVSPDSLHQLLHRRIDESAELDRLAKGLPASPGAACGKVVFDADEADRRAADGEAVILVRPETTPEDIHGIVASQGVLTSRGGMTSHAAVVARGMGKPCVCGCESIRIDLRKREFVTEGGRVIREGDIITIDGGTGHVYAGAVPLVEPELSQEFRELLHWADGVRRLRVLANADTPEDAAKAREFGAEGIGLCRTEHMFLGPDRVPVVQRMILAEDEEERRRALEDLLPLQRKDFVGILKAMAGLPVTVRLLDPPLHEFLPNLEDLLVEVTQLRERGGDPGRLRERETLLRKVRALHEANPMLGHRGCRLGITFPDVYRVQVRALYEAAAELVREGVDVRPEVMIPLVGHRKELEILRRVAEEEARRVLQEQGVQVPIRIGTMIEVPRAALTADEIASEADFFSFGTNDLTQMTFGFSRDDAEGKFLHHYVHGGILESDPFVNLDEDGVGKLIRWATEQGRKVKPELKAGICGEHGGDPRSIAFCHRVGLDYVSCSPYRVPVARLAAARAVLEQEQPSLE